SAPGAERDVVFARAALVGMAFDQDTIVRIAVEPHGLLVERRHRCRRQRRGIGFEEDPIADGDEEFLLAARRAAPRRKVAHARTAARTGRKYHDEEDEREPLRKAHEG